MVREQSQQETFTLKSTSNVRLAASLGGGSISFLIISRSLEITGHEGVKAGPRTSKSRSGFGR